MFNIEIIDSLLKSELSSAELYQRTLDFLQNNGDVRESGILIAIFNGHKNAVSSLQYQIHDFGETFSKRLRVSKEFYKVIQSGYKNMLNIKSILKYLLEVEKNITKDYESALENKKLPMSIQYLIQWKLLLIQKSHTRTLERLLDTVTA